MNTRPRAISIISVVFAVYAAYQLISWHQSRALMPYAFFQWMVFSYAGLCILTAAGLWRMKTWARKLAVFFSLINLLMSGYALMMAAVFKVPTVAPAQVLPGLVTAILSGAIFFYLGRPDVRASFGSLEVPGSRRKFPTVMVVVLLSVLVLGGMIAVPFIVTKFAGFGKPPDNLVVGVKMNTASVSKMPAVDYKSLGGITDMRWLKGPGGSVQLAIVGSKGVSFVDERMALQKEMALESLTGQVELVDIEADGVPEFMNRGGGWQPVFLMGADGKVLWRGPRGTGGPNNMAAGDVDGDGLTGFVIGYNGGDGVELVDSKGARRWIKGDRNVWHIEIVKEASGTPVILHTNATGSIVRRSTTGELLTTKSAPIYATFFSLCPWPAPDSAPHLLISGNGHLWFVTPQGDVAAKLQAPDLAEHGEARAVFVPTKAGSHALAAAVSYANWERSLLYVFDAAGTLVYEEVMPASCQAIATYEIGGPSAPSFLVGCQDKVIRYDLAKGEGRL